MGAAQTNHVKTFLASVLVYLCTSVALISQTNEANPKNTNDDHPTYDNTIGVKYGSQVYLDFARGIMIPSTLPFDVPFTLTGKVPKNIIQINMSFLEVEDIRKNNYEVGGCDCENNNLVLLTAKAKATSTDSAIDSSINGCMRCVKYCIPLCPWRQSAMSRIDGDSVWFYIDMPPLKPNRYYRFFFSFLRQLDSMEIDQIANKARLIIHSNLSTLFTDTSATPSDTDYQIALLESENQINEGFNTNKTYVDNDENALLPSEKLQGCLNNLTLQHLYMERTDFHNIYTNEIPAKSVTLKCIYSSVLDTLLNNLRFDTILTASDKLLLSNSKTMKDAVFQNAVIGEQIYTGQRVLFSKNSPLPMLDIHENDTSAFDPYVANIDNTISELNKLIEMYSTTFRTKEMKNNFRTPNGFTLVEGILNNLRTAILELESAKTYLTWMRSDLVKIYQELDIQRCVDFTRVVFMQFSGGSFGDFYTRSEWYLTFDAGLAGTWDASNGGVKKSFGIVPYYALNLNLFPVNRQVHYSFFGGLHKKSYYRFYRGFSLIIGLTATPITDQKIMRTDLFPTTNNSLVSGVGLRMNDYIRLAGGIMWGRRQVDVLNAETYVQMYPYFSLSIDLDIYKYYKTVRSEFFIKEKP